MKMSLTMEADTVNILALNMSRFSVDIDGIELTDLINVVCDDSYTHRVADEPGKRVAACDKRHQHLARQPRERAAALECNPACKLNLTLRSTRGAYPERVVKQNDIIARHYPEELELISQSVLGID
ncbi:Uncharacterised protein [Citrobacter youngae]|uniref:YeeW-like domain-containing protein n=1 Tax=Citrobacter youngae TaxID=133448 RepID=A0ABM8MET0_9ENTR|nr:hypothetical protein [Citrobacter sedlakii]MBU5386605.1 hypothetical protein [Citrobacter cronae]CAB5540132.1 Uncharacterised protein [Citrobacter youngae]CAC9105988.1 Uncharacterised protein [Citrobacter youngae]